MHFLKKNIYNFFNSYLDNKRDEINRSDYHINKLLYRNSQEEFIDTDPSPWEVLTNLISFEKNILKFSTLIEENL